MHALMLSDYTFSLRSHIRLGHGLLTSYALCLKACRAGIMPTRWQARAMMRPHNVGSRSASANSPPDRHFSGSAVLTERPWYRQTDRLRQCMGSGPSSHAGSCSGGEPLSASCYAITIQGDVQARHVGDRRQRRKECPGCVPIGFRSVRTHSVAMGTS